MNVNGGQPGIEYIQACRLFNPKNCAVLSKDPLRYRSIPLLRGVPRPEFDLYMNTLGPQYISDVQAIDVIKFLEGSGAPCAMLI